MKKALSVVALFNVTFLAYFLAALAKAINKNLSVGICAAVAAFMALITTIAYYVKNALTKKRATKRYKYHLGKACRYLFERTCF